MSQTAATTQGRARRGRPRRGEREARQQHVLDAALAELVENGYDNTTMLSIASRAGASKETLYSWFGNRDGLLRALIERSADGSAQRVSTALDAALDTGADARETLLGYSVRLLTLLTSTGSIALNRAAMTNLGLAELLLASGRHRVGPVVERYLAQLHERGVLHAPDPPAAYSLLYGLVVEDTQIRVLLGEQPPAAEQVQARCERAVDHFFRLLAPPRAEAESSAAG